MMPNLSIHSVVQGSGVQKTPEPYIKVEDDGKRPRAIHNGVRHVCFARVHLDVVETPIDEEGVDNNRPLFTKELIKKQQIILNGKFHPEKFVSPTVEIIDGKYILRTGQHTHQAKKGTRDETGDEYLDVEIVEFFNDKGETADYWRIIWGSNENSESSVEYHNFTRSVNYVVMAVKKLITTNTIKNTEKAIKKALRDQGITSQSTKYAKYISDIKLAIDKNSKTVKIYDKDSKAEWIKDNFPEVKTSTATKIFEQNNNVYFEQEFIGVTGYKNLEDTNYDSRVIKKIINATIKKPGVQTHIISQVNNYKSSKINDVRKFKEDLLIKREVERYRKFIKLYDEGKFKNPKFIWLPQLPEELNND